MAAVTALPPINATALSGIAFGGLLAFIASIGFEDRQHRRGSPGTLRDIPRAMVLSWFQ